MGVAVAVFAFTLAALARVKHAQNVAQVEHERGRPARAQAHFAAAAQAERDYRSRVWALGGDLSPARVRDVLDPGGARQGYPDWSAVPRADTVGLAAAFNDPRTRCKVRLRFELGTLHELEVIWPPLVERPVPFYVAGEMIRKVLGVVCGLGWVVAVCAAYYDPLLRRRVVWAALATAAVATTAWALEPPATIRDKGFRVPYGPWVGAGMLLLTLPALYRTLRPARATAGRCLRCDYDLTGNESGVCPECGEPTPAEAVRRRKARAAELAAPLERVDPGVAT